MSCFETMENAANLAGLEFVEADGKLMARFQPDGAPARCEREDLARAIDAAGYGALWRDEAAFEALLKHCRSGTACELALGERRDAEARLEIAADKMSATICLVPACGGQTPAAEALRAALAEAGVSNGIDGNRIAGLAGAGGGEAVVAQGKPPRHGADAAFEALVPDMRDRTPRVDAQGTVDFRDLGEIPLVAPGDALMRRIPATPGEAGVDVTGQTVLPNPGKDLPFAATLHGAQLSAEDPDLLRATIRGMPVRLANGVNVEQILTVDNVDLHTGNLTFDGTVHIKGEIQPAMKVTASGDVTVAGVVEGAEIEAGGDVQVGGGIIGKSRVCAGGTVSAKFAEGSHIAAGDTIAIEDTVVQCDLQAINQVLVGTKQAKRGRIMGGSVRAAMLVRAPIIGSPTSGVTNVLVGVNPVLEAQYQQLLQAMEKKRQEEEELEKVIALLKKQPERKAMLEKAKLTWQHTLQEWARMMSRKDELENQLALVENARVEVTEGCTGAIHLCIGKKTKDLRRDMQSGVFHLAEGELVFTSGA